MQFNDVIYRYLRITFFYLEWRDDVIHKQKLAAVLDFIVAYFIMQ